MTIKFQSGFLKLAKALVGWVGVVLLLWAMWIWRITIVEVGVFALISVARTLVNTVLVVGAAYILGWFIPWLVAKYVLDGVKAPRIPLRIAKYASIAAVALGLLLVPVDMSVHRKITDAVRTIAAQFEHEAHCDGYDCYAPEEVLRERDQAVRRYGGVRIGGWFIRGYWRAYGGADTSAIRYLWNAPFFLL